MGGKVTGRLGTRVEIAMMRTPGGRSRPEFSRFLTPPVFADHRNSPVNSLAYLHAMFAVDNIDETRRSVSILLNSSPDVVAKRELNIGGTPSRS
jgi:hypothetical protein